MRKCQIDLNKKAITKSKIIAKINKPITNALSFPKPKGIGPRKPTIANFVSPFPELIREKIITRNPKIIKRIPKNNIFSGSIILFSF